MDDIEAFRKEIELCIKDWPREKLIILALRSAMRVLPLLAVTSKSSLSSELIGIEKKAFPYWLEEARADHLLAIFRACAAACADNAYAANAFTRAAADASYAAAFKADAAHAAADAYDIDYTAFYAARAAAYAAAYAARAAAYAARAAAYAARAAANAARADAAHAVAAAAHAAARAADYYADRADYAAHAADYYYADRDAYAAAEGDAINAIHYDLWFLGANNPADLWVTPLWQNAMPESFQTLLGQFRCDVLSLNAGFEVWLAWYEEHLQGKAIDRNLLHQWVFIPKEIEAQGPAKINAYLKSLSQPSVDQQPKQPLNRVRTIFIGYGEAGKTSLIRALHGEIVIPGKEPMTPGIAIRDWDVPGTEIKAHFWDFGGQVMFHSTHQFFLRSSCVYVVVLNARTDIKDSEQAEYWLQHIKIFGGNAPVLLVGNKADEAGINLQLQTLTEKYPNIRGYFPVSCTHAQSTYKAQFDCFVQALTAELQNVGMHLVLFTPAQEQVLEELRQDSLEQAFLSEDKFNAICDRHQVSNEGDLDRAWLVDIFDKLGVMLHFDDLKDFHNSYMLNPRWLTWGIYTLINAKQARLTSNDVLKLLKDTPVKDEYEHLLSYPGDKCLFLIKAMQKFKLCYPLSKQNNTVLIPALLAGELPHFLAEFKSDEVLHFEFAFTSFLPRNLIGQF